MKNTNQKTLKIPVNVSEIFDYGSLFRYVLDNGFIPEPYLSSSKYSIREGQDNKYNFFKYMELFLTYKEVKLLPGLIHLVYNTRSDDLEIFRDIDSTIAKLEEIGFKVEDLNLIIAHPRIIKYYVARDFNVTISSASVLSYKRIIDLLLECPLPVKGNVSYVLPSTYQFSMRKLPVNSFEIMLQDGCMLGCINATVATDHTKFCPIHKKDLNVLYYDEFQDKTDVIHRWKFMSLVHQGWKSFKIAGRQASMETIFDVVRYYLNTKDVKIPYIDNPLFYGGRSSNG